MKLELLDESEKAEFSVEEEKYDGPDRRIEQRRKIPDQRASVRFEPGKIQRRSGKDRRKGFGVWRSTI